MAPLHFFQPVLVVGAGLYLTAEADADPANMETMAIAPSN
jgi:hypothetical protein